MSSFGRNDDSQVRPGAETRPLVRAGVGWDELFEEILLHGRDRGGGKRFTAGGGGDDCQELEVSERRPGNVEALGVGAGVRRGELQTGVLNEVVGEGNVDGGEALEELAGAKGHTKPEAFGAWLGQEGAAAEPLRVCGVVQIEIADVADVLDVVEQKWNDPSGEVEEVDCAVADEAGERQVAGESFAGKTTDDHLFVGGGHRTRGLSHGRTGPREKGAGKVASSPMLCYTYVLCLRVKNSINA